MYLILYTMKILIINILVTGPVDQVENDGLSGVGSIKLANS